MGAGPPQDLKAPVVAEDQPVVFLTPLVGPEVEPGRVLCTHALTQLFPFVNLLGSLSVLPVLTVFNH